VSDRLGARTLAWAGGIVTLLGDRPLMPWASVRECHQSYRILANARGSTNTRDMEVDLTLAFLGVAVIY
jgi:hypothetical protein